MTLSGLLPINKPEGMISKDVSRWLVKRAGKLKLGHVGTLDPAASGVLPLLIGRATRLQDLLLDMPKAYEFDVQFGVETDTLDKDGQVTRQRQWEHIEERGLRAATLDFIGDLEQTPPLYSAVKYKGKPLYEYARADKGESVPLEGLKRKVRVTDFELLAYEGGIGKFRVSCSRGTYVRSLVKDVAEKVGSCGTLTRLVRTEAAGIRVGDAISLEALEGRLPDLNGSLVPIEDIDVGLIKWRAGSAVVESDLRLGRQVNVDSQDYFSGVATGDDPSLSGWSKSVLLLGAKSGQTFGIGVARRNEAGRVVISMKRGL